MSDIFDYTSTPPDKKTPWKSPIHHRGEDAWNGSKEARAHPELCSTGYGTIDIDIDRSQSSNKNPAPHPDQSNSKQDKSESDDKEKDVYGHTVHSRSSPQNYVHRDLKDI
ncbi:hypothetical protein CLU79DRAFT_750206 [Phycomyces nitens]|nr:hypothetical protein CLU79DRAFT_750206 [Phycomyces nitens]